jgi:hypothetical protein
MRLILLAARAIINGKSHYPGDTSDATRTRPPSPLRAVELAALLLAFRKG